MRNASRLVGVMFLVCSAACNKDAPAQGDTELSDRNRHELLVGYELLSNTLSDESNLGKLELFKKLTLAAPNDEIGKLMNKLADASDKRGDELEKLRAKAPDVRGKPEHTSPVGDAINEVAKDFGKADMMSRNGGFDVRFVLVQAQATRMVGAMATAVARLDPNPDRKVWLRRLALEYEGYRGELVKYMGGAPADKPD